MGKRNKRIALIVFSLVTLLSGIMLAGCSQTEAGNPNKEAIEKVLELQFNGPDEKFMDLMWNPEYKTVIDGVEVNKEFDKYVQEKYGEYFTENALDTFIRAFGTTYPSLAYSNNYTLKLKEVTIKSSENASNKYTFTAQVGYQKDDGEEEDATVDGVVLFSTAEKKIGTFQYGTDMSLVEGLRN